MRRDCLPFILAAALLTGGCELDSPSGDAPPASESPFQAPPLLQGPRRPTELLISRVRLVILKVPLGTISRSERLWSYVDEERADPVRTANLGRNGVRAGVVSGQHWPDVMGLLEDMTGRPLRLATMIARPGEPMTVTLKKGQPVQTLFIWHDDRTVSGRDYPPGDNLLTVSCSPNPREPSKAVMTVVPRLRTAAERITYGIEGGAPLLSSRPGIRGFDAMAFQSVMSEDDVLVIGPGAASRRPTSIGGRFFLDDALGVEHEMVLLMIPEAEAVPLK